MPPRKNGFVRLSKFEVDRREQRRLLIAEARANSGEKIIRDGQIFTIVHLPSVGRT